MFRGRELRVLLHQLRDALLVIPSMVPTSLLSTRWCTRHSVGDAGLAGRDPARSLDRWKVAGAVAGSARIRWETPP